MPEQRYKTLEVSAFEGGAIIRLNRPEVRNALSTQLMEELASCLEAFSHDDSVGAVVLTGSEKAFAAGADIQPMARKSFAEVFKEDFFVEPAVRIERFRKPLIAAVAGYALGGGCELAMLCDLIVAADTARFGQPEIKLGVAPGMGGTQRLARAIGKAKSMDLVLTGRLMDASEAERAGLVSRVVPATELISEAISIAQQISKFSSVAVMMNKELVTAAFDTTLSQGLKLERRLFHSLFAFDDQKEGMSAFLEKREAKFTGR